MRHKHIADASRAYVSMGAWNDGIIDIYYPCTVYGCEVEATYGVSFESLKSDGILALDDSCWDDDDYTDKTETCDHQGYDDCFGTCDFYTED